MHENTGDNPGWHLVSDEYYVRDVSGKEIALYSGTSLTQWNIWGLDNIGKINSDTTRNYYLKDHLGSIRVVLNSTNQVISAQDYDAWGYPLENRTYNSTAMLYDFTGKERDNQTTYDYFGARYYDSRIANWASIDPLFEKHFDYSPYNYVLRSPLVLIDPDGKQVNYQMKFDVGLESGGTKESEKIYELSNGELSAYQPGTLEPEAMDPVDILTGMAMAKIGFKMADKFVFKEGTQIVSKTVAKETLTESTEKVVKFSSKKGEDLFQGFVDYLGVEQRVN